MLSTKTAQDSSIGIIQVIWTIQPHKFLLAFLQNIYSTFTFKKFYPVVFQEYDLKKKIKKGTSSKLKFLLSFHSRNIFVLCLSLLNNILIFTTEIFLYTYTHKFFFVSVCFVYLNLHEQLLFFFSCFSSLLQQTLLQKTTPLLTACLSPTLPF